MSSPAELHGAWPLLMDEGITARMLTVTKPCLRRLVSQGHVPASRNHGGLERWHRDEVAAHLRRAWGLDAADRIAEEHKQAAQVAVDTWGPPKDRRTRRKKGDEKTGH